jgi:hypothetical protein
MLPVAILKSEPFFRRCLGRKHRNLLGNREANHPAQFRFSRWRAGKISEGSDHCVMDCDEAVDQRAIAVKYYEAKLSLRH